MNMQKQKGFTPIAIILIVLGILAIAGGIWYYLAQSPETKDETASWQTYRNDEYGFEVKYPSSFIVSETKSAEISIGSAATPYINIAVYSGKTNMDFQSFVQEKLIEESGSLLDISKVRWMQKEIQGEQAIEVTFKNIAGGHTGDVVWDYIPKGNKVYKIALLTDFKIEGKLIPYLTLHDQILSTFKFIK